MIFKKTKTVAVALSSLLILSMGGTQACAPELASATIVNTCHPDVPLKFFAAGNLGIIQPGMAKSYLCVVYRYLIGMPLDANEQASMVNAWHSRLAHAMYMAGEGDVDEQFQYLKLRAKVLGTKDAVATDRYSLQDAYSYNELIGNDAFRVAKETLNGRIQKYGLKSSAVKEWVKGQDTVFGIDKRKSDTIQTKSSQAIPHSLGTPFDSLLQADRKYQIAAAYFYAGDYTKSAQLFAEIAQDKQSAWNKIASYLVARSYANAVLGGIEIPQEPDPVDYLKKQLAKATGESARANLFDLLRPVSYMNKGQDEIIASIIPNILRPHAERFGADVGDLSTVMDSGTSDISDQKGADDHETSLKLRDHDLTDWLLTIQRRDDDYMYYSDQDKAAAMARQNEQTKHALEKWRATHSLPWMVAAMSCNGLRSAEVADLRQAAEKIAPDSPAYLTAYFYINDALIFQKQTDEARLRVEAILAKPNLPVSTRNLFKCQLMPVSNHVDDFLGAAFQNAPEITAGYFDLPTNFFKLEKQSAFHTEDLVLDGPVADDLNAHLPFSQWIKLARSCKDQKLAGRLRRLVWVRGNLLNQMNVSDEFAKGLVASYPVLGSLMQRYTAAPAGDAKTFAAACIILRNFGMSPYLDPGAERYADAIDTFNYYNANFWLPIDPGKKKSADDAPEYALVSDPNSNVLLKRMQDYYKPGVNRLLSAQERKQAESEEQLIWKNHPSRFLGEAVLAWAKSHPDDPLVPEMLYRVNKLPKWSGVSAPGSEYSRKTYALLHSKYPKNRWTAKAPCYY